MRRHRRPTAATLAMMSIAFLASTARGADPGEGVLRALDGFVEWRGRIEGPTIAPSDPSQCDASIPGLQERLCDRFRLRLDLPEGSWPASSGSVEFAIRYDDYNSTERDLDLYVVDSGGVVVGRSTGQDSEAEVAFVHTPPNGFYDVIVAASTSPDPIDYEGRIEIEPDPVRDPAGSGRDLLPDLVALQPKMVTLQSAQYLVSPVHNSVTSCYPEETVDASKGSDPPALRCLRFDQIVANEGAGALELRFRPEDEPVAPPMLQRVHRSDGSWSDRFAGTGELHAIHGHWHYTGFGSAALYDTRGDLVVQGRKRGFCLIDVLFTRWARKGNDPRKASFPGCQIPGDDGWVVEGIGVGWADNYNWFLADQYLNVTQVPDGVYRLDIVANPNAVTGEAPGLAESDYGNNVSHTWICLTASRVSVVGSPSAPCAA